MHFSNQHLHLILECIYELHYQIIDECHSIFPSADGIWGRQRRGHGSHGGQERHHFPFVGAKCHALGHWAVYMQALQWEESHYQSTCFARYPTVFLFLFLFHADNN